MYPVRTKPAYADFKYEDLLVHMINYRRLSSRTLFNHGEIMRTVYTFDEDIYAFQFCFDMILRLIYIFARTI